MITQGPAMGMPPAGMPPQPGMPGMGMPGMPPGQQGYYGM